MTMGGEMAATKKVLGVELAKVDRKVLLAELKDAVGEAPRSTEGAVIALATHYQKAHQGKKLMVCEDCGGPSPEALDHCPYCGGTDGEPAKVNGHLNGAAPLVLLKGEVELDKAIANIRRIRVDGAKSLWQLGSELKGVYANELWRQRTNGGGAPKYKSFAAFVNEEIELKPASVFRLIEMVDRFQLAQAEKHGTTMLRSLLAAPKEDHDELLGKVERGEIKTHRGLEAEVDKARKRRGTKVARGGKRTEKATAAAAEAKAAKPKLVTVALPDGKLQIPLLAKGKEPATSIADKPVGKVELRNGVVLRVSVVANAKGEWVVNVEAKRPAE
jgi:hypothetical protein